MPATRLIHATPASPHDIVRAKMQEAADAGVSIEDMRDMLNFLTEPQKAAYVTASDALDACNKKVEEANATYEKVLIEAQLNRIITAPAAGGAAPAPGAAF